MSRSGCLATKWEDASTKHEMPRPKCQWSQRQTESGESKRDEEISRRKAVSTDRRVRDGVTPTSFSMPWRTTATSRRLVNDSMHLVPLILVIIEESGRRPCFISIVLFSSLSLGTQRRFFKRLCEAPSSWPFPKGTATISWPFLLTLSMLWY